MKTTVFGHVNVIFRNGSTVFDEFFSGMVNRNDFPVSYIEVTLRQSNTYKIFKYMVIMNRLNNKISDEFFKACRVLKISMVFCLKCPLNRYFRYAKTVHAVHHDLEPVITVGQGLSFGHVHATFFCLNICQNKKTVKNFKNNNKK